MTAQIRLVNNVVRVGDTLSMGWSGETGQKFTLRYAFGTLSGTIKSNPPYNSYGWTIPTGFTDEMGGRYVMDGVVYLDTYDGSELIGTTEAVFTVANQYIIVPQLSSYNLEVGQTVTVTLERWGTLYEHRNLGYSFGTAGAAITMNFTGIGTTIASREITIPLETAKGIPDATNGYLEIYCDTYSTLSKSIVGSVTVRVQLRVPETEETKPGLTLTVAAESTLDDVFDGLYIRGKTKVRVTAAATSSTSEIGAVTIQAGSEMAAGTEALFDLTGSTVSIRATATDKRGYGRTVTEIISAMAYSGPSVTPVSGCAKVICTRATADGTENPKGENLLIRAARRYTSIGSGLNKCVLRYRIKPAGGEYSAWTQLLGEGDTGNEYNGVVSGVVLNAKTGYSFQIGVADTIGEFHNVTVPIPAAGVPFHIGKGNRNVSVGGYCDYGRKDVFDMHFTQYFFTGAAAQAVFEDGSWAAGTELSGAIPEADLTGIGTYNLLIGVSGGLPVLLVKAGSIIAGGGIRMDYTETDGTERLTLTEAEAPVTALYKLL